jgi:hypothetical protein
MDRWFCWFFDYWEGSLFREPWVEEKIVWNIDAPLTRAQVLTRIEKKLEAALVDVSDVRDRHVIKHNTMPQLGRAGFPALISVVLPGWHQWEVYHRGNPRKQFIIDLSLM